jgi:hypothetical protein
VYLRFTACDPFRKFGQILSISSPLEAQAGTRQKKTIIFSLRKNGSARSPMRGKAVLDLRAFNAVLDAKDWFGSGVGPCIAPYFLVSWF